MKGKAKNQKKQKYSKKASSTPVAEVQVAETVDSVANMDGMVVPAMTPPSAAPVSTPADIMSTPPPANPVTGSRLPPLTGTAAAAGAAYSKRVQ
jgi:hypothetical protein